MTYKLTTDQLAQLPPELRDALANGPVTVKVERVVWEPNPDILHELAYRGAARSYFKLIAWREEHCPGWVPENGGLAWTPMLNNDGEFAPVPYIWRHAISIELPEDACRKLCDALNSGEVVL
jgi:hypothetical protein